MNGDSRAEIQGRGSKLVSVIRPVDGDVGTVGETKLDKKNGRHRWSLYKTIPSQRRGRDAREKSGRRREPLRR